MEMEKEKLLSKLFYCNKKKETNKIHYLNQQFKARCQNSRFNLVMHKNPVHKFIIRPDPKCGRPKQPQIKRTSIQFN